jgi:hypothetical protein
MRVYAPALACLLAAQVAGCDKLKAMPGMEQSSALAPGLPAVAAGPWLLDPMPGQVTVAWITAEPSVGRVWFGTPEPDTLVSEETAPAKQHRVTLTSLPPGTQIRYRIEGSTDASWFTSAPEAGSEAAFTVLVYGDNRTNSGDHALVARAAAAEHAQVALHTGDMVVNASDAALWKVWFHEEHDLLAHTPLVPTVGNHEITDNGAAYSRYFQHSNRPPYWSLDYGPVHVVVLDSFETAAGATPHSAGVSEAQKAWLEEDLRKVPKERHVWVLVHQGPYAHPAHPRGAGHGGSDAVKAALAVGARAHPIEAVFAGHEHFYERGQIDGLNYFVLGGGGAPLEDPDGSVPGVKAARKALSYATVQVCGCHAQGVAKDIAGRIIDSFTLADCPTPCGAPGAAAPVASSSLAIPLVSLTESADAGMSDGGAHHRAQKKHADEPDAGQDAGP